MTLEGIDDVHGSDGLPLSVLGVGDSIPDDILEEYLQNTAGLFIDEARNTLDTASTGKTTDGGLGDTLDIVTKHLAMPLGAPLAEPLSTFTTSSHDGWIQRIATDRLHCSSIYRLGRDVRARQAGRCPAPWLLLVVAWFVLWVCEVVIGKTLL